MEIKCIPLSQPIGTFYLAAIKASVLLQLCYKNEAVLNDGKMIGNQRRHVNKRSEEIARYLESEDATIPNSLILSANYSESDEFVIEYSKAWRFDEDTCSIIIPDPDLKICSVVDGQHRLWAFEETEEDFLLPCSIFLDLPPSLQAYIFSTINFNQKPVSKSDAYQLFGYQLEKSDPSTWSPDLLAVNISRTFNKVGPFEGRIVLLTSSEKVDGWNVSSAAFIEGVISLISGNLKRDKYTISRRSFLGIAGRKALDKNSKYPLRDLFIEGNDKAIVEVIDRYFDSFSELVWGFLPDDNILFRTVGLAAQFDFLKYLLMERKVKINSLLTFHELISPLKGLVLHGDYFSARSATKKRIVDVFKFKCGYLTDPVVSREIEDALHVNLIDDAD